jgi:hypothetical protein
VRRLRYRLAGWRVFAVLVDGDLQPVSRMKAVLQTVRPPSVDRTTISLRSSD